MFFADSEWWGWHCGKAEFQAFAGEKCSIEPTGMHITDGDIMMLRNAGDFGLSRDPNRVFNGRNGGFMAFNIAVLTGAATVILLGYDAKAPRDGEPSHFFGHHPVREPHTVYPKYRECFERTLPEINASGVSVINATPGSAIACFPRMTIADALAC